MQYSFAAIIALAASTVAAYSNSTEVFVTEVFTAYTTFCPASTQLTFNGVTYTATESTTLTITNCPCTVVKPASTSSVVYCNTCAVSSAPAVYANSTIAKTTPAKTSAVATSVGTSTITKATGTASPSPITASSGNKAFAFSGASLAGLLAAAAYLFDTGNFMTDERGWSGHGWELATGAWGLNMVFCIALWSFSV